MNKRHTQESDLPPPLARDLAELYEAPFSVPRRVDDKIAETAWRQCEANKSRRRVRRWGRLGAVAAAVVMLVLARDLLRRPDRPQHAVAPPAAIQDIDDSGRVDILDAFALARRIEAGARLDPRWDVTRDGVVDGADVDAVASAAVRLNGGAS